MEICVFEVNWKVFEATFPKLGDWMEVCDSQVDFDAFGFNIECASVYGRFGCNGPLISRSSPEQVSQILDGFAAIPKGKLDEGLKANWDKTKAEMFENPKQFASYVKNWIKVLKAIKKARNGLAIDIFT